MPDRRFTIELNRRYTSPGLTKKVEPKGTGKSIIQLGYVSQWEVDLREETRRF
jgi:hypothetical protein